MPYPDATDDIKRLVEDHRDTLVEDGKPLVLAVYYRSKAAPDDECLLEVAQDFGGNEVSRTGEMMQVEFGPTARYPLEGHSLRLTLTSPNECEFALEQRWAEVQDVVEAAHQQQAMVIFSGDGEAGRLVGALGLAGPV